MAAMISLSLSGLAVAVYWLVFTWLLALGTPPVPPEGIPHLFEMLIGWVVAPHLAT